MTPIRSGISTGAFVPLFSTLLLSCLFLSRPSQAMELSLLGGATESVDTGKRSAAWQAMYRQNFSRNFAFSLSWVNEGHLGARRRDGAAAQAWGGVPLLDNLVSLGIGAGVYRYFDTVVMPDGDHRNLHGWAPVYSLAATYSFRDPWFAQVAVLHIHPGGEFASDTFLAGIGYRSWKEADPSSGWKDRDTARTTGYEILPFLGQVVVNSEGNEPGIGSGIEFRKGIGEQFDWTLTWLNEDVSGTLDRVGLGTQIWLVDAFLGRRVTLGFGAGLYSFVDFEPPADSGRSRDLDIAGLLTVTTSYRFSDRWFTRFLWNRVMSNDSRDSDMFLLGLGYRWGRRSGDE